MENEFSNTFFTYLLGLNRVMHVKHPCQCFADRFRGLDLIESLMDYGWRFVTLYRRQGSRPSPRKEMQKGKMVV